MYTQITVILRKYLLNQNLISEPKIKIKMNIFQNIYLHHHQYREKSVYSVVHCIIHEATLQELMLFALILKNVKKYLLSSFVQD